MSSQLPQSSLGTGNVWTQLMDGLMGRVTARSCPCGAGVVRVPRPGAWRRREDSFLGMELGLESLPRKEAGVGVGGRGGDKGRESQKRLQHSSTSPGGPSQDTGMPGLLCSSLLWPESPPPTQVGKDAGATLNLSEGSRRLLTMGISTASHARSPRWRETSSGHQLGLPHRGESNPAFQRGTCYTAGSTRALTAEPSNSPGRRQQQLAGKGEWLGNVRCQDDPCAIKTKLNSIWDARPRAPQRPVLWFSSELATVSQRGFILKEEENSIC